MQNILFLTKYWKIWFLKNLHLRPLWTENVIYYCKIYTLQVLLWKFVIRYTLSEFVKIIELLQKLLENSLTIKLLQN